MADKLSTWRIDRHHARAPATAWDRREVSVMSALAMAAGAAPAVAGVPRARLSPRHRAASRSSSTRVPRAIQDTAAEGGDVRGAARDARARGGHPRPRGHGDEGGVHALDAERAALTRAEAHLVVDLPEGRGLVAREEVKRGESLLSIPESTLITVERAVAESKLGPAHAKLQEWSLLAAFLAEQALAIEAGDDSGRSATYVRALPRRTGGVPDWPEADVESLLAGSPSLWAGAGAPEQRGGRDRGDPVLVPAAHSPGHCAGP